MQATVAREFLPEAPQVSALRAWLVEQMQLLAVPDEISFRVQLCAEELFTNLVMHANWPRGPLPVAVMLGYEDSRVTLELKDAARAFNPDDAPVRDSPASIEVAAIGGLGVKFVREFSEGLRYASEADGNRTSVTFEPRETKA